jgi:ribosomal protein S18 acetylase RimI-like enzyme
MGRLARYRRMSELDRIVGFLRRVDEGASTSVERLPFGLAFFHAELPRVYDRNFVLVTDADVSLGTNALIRAVDEVQGDAGLLHRKVVFEREETGERLAGALGRGWEHRRLSVMAYRAKPDGTAAQDPPEVSEVDREALLPALETMIKMEPADAEDANEEVIRQLSSSDAALERVVAQRCFARLVDGQVVSSCRLYSDGTIAQVEDVATVPGHRQRGHADAVVARAVNEATAGHELVFLTAVDGRWVKCWYERLGFEQIGLRYEATRSA